MTDRLLIVDNISKKFCRRFKRSLWYGMMDLAFELVGYSNSQRALRKAEFWAVRDASFDLKCGEMIGLIGRNGAGKTTILRMLNGLIRPDAGRIEINGKMQALIALGVGFNPILTGRENIYIKAAVLGMSKVEVDKRFDEIVDFSGVEEFIDTPVQSYSSGMAVRLGFAVAAHMEPEILLIDEVLAVGDEAFQAKCLNKIGELKRAGAGIVLVSHNMHHISTSTERVVLMNNGKLQVYDDVSEGIKEYRKTYYNSDNMDIMKVYSGNDQIKFTNVQIENRSLCPGDSFTMRLEYEAIIDYLNVEIDVLIFSSREHTLHFQATNKAYQKTIDLLKGNRFLDMTIENIRINDALGRVSIAIWVENRFEKLFWWEIPVKFHNIKHASGNNFLNISFDTGAA